MGDEVAVANALDIPHSHYTLAPEVHARVQELLRQARERVIQHLGNVSGQQHRDFQQGLQLDEERARRLARWRAARDGQAISTSPPSTEVPDTGNLFWGRPGELNFFDTNVATAVIVSNANPVVHDLIEIPGGNGVQQRVGQRIMLKNICVKGSIFVSLTDVENIPIRSFQQDWILHVWICLDRQPNGASAPWEAVVTEKNMDQAHRVVDYSERFAVLHKCHTHLKIEPPRCTATPTQNATRSTEGRATFMCMMNVDEKCTYNGAAAGVPRTNNVFIVYGLGKSIYSTNGNTPEIEYSTRVRYTSY